MSKKEISVKGKATPGQAAALLADLKESLLKGKICVQSGGEHVCFDLDSKSDVEFELGAAEKKGKNKITIELSWRDYVEMAATDQGLIISSTPPPEPKPEPKPAPGAAAKPAPKAEAKPAAPKAADAKAAPKPEAKAAPKAADAKPDAKPAGSGPAKA